jgi:SSS family solute:Na+ symporter
VALLLVGYAGVTQFFPGVVLGLYWKRASTIAVFAGIVTGVAIVAGLMLTKHDPVFGLNAGFLALCANFLVTVLLSLASRPRPNGFIEDRAEDASEVIGS